MRKRPRRVLALWSLILLGGCTPEHLFEKRAKAASRPNLLRGGDPSVKRQRSACLAGVSCDRISRLMRPEQTPALHEPRAVPAKRATGLRPTDRVLGISLDGEARAYPLNLLAYHRVADDLLGKRRVLVAFSPLSESSLCADYTERVRASGQVYENDDLLVDDRTGDLWSILLGQSIQGRRSGARLSRLPCAVMTWASWRDLKPKTTVAWPKRAPLGFDYTRDPWVWYREDDRYLVMPLHYADLRAPWKETVLGVALKKPGSAFLLPEHGQRVLNTILDGAPVLILLDGKARFGAVYSRRLRDRTPTLQLVKEQDRILLEDKQTQSRWDLFGEPLGGPLASERLEAVPSQTVLFFAWSAFHQGTTITGSER
jgi:hypothetical protein